jgi:GNAT superfamily N-acetyltransferase
MEIIDLNPELEELYFLCLEDWSDEAKEAGCKKSEWYPKMKERGLRVKLVKDDNGEVAGLIQYLPIEESHIFGEGLYFILCIWVHGYKEGRGNLQKKGLGKALLAAAEADAKELGAKGMVAWGVSLPFWMRAAWFKKQGYKKCDKYGVGVLLWKKFGDGDDNDARAPKWNKLKNKPQKVPGRVTVVSIVNGWCLAQNLVYERAKRAAAQFGEKVDFIEIDTSDKAALAEWGVTDGLFIDGKAVRTGPPPSYASIKEMIAKRVRKLK